MFRGHGWARVTGDKIVNAGPMILWGIVLRVSTTGGDVTLYEGLDTESGRLIDTFEGIANESRPVNLFGLRLDRGLYVDVGSNVDSLLVIWDPVHLDEV